MLALATGWTPDTIAGLPGPFRAACHLALQFQAVLPDGIPELPASGRGMSPEQRVAVGRARVAQANLRKWLFPDDE